MYLAGTTIVFVALKSASALENSTFLPAKVFFACSATFEASAKVLSALLAVVSLTARSFLASVIALERASSAFLASSSFV